MTSDNFKEEMYQPTLSRSANHRWAHEHQYATMRFFEASDDYAAARCCILNGLFSGFVLASQAIERMLKARIYLETGKKPRRIHNLMELKKELPVAVGAGLDAYGETLRKLSAHYESRYFENRTSNDGASTSELPDIDRLWLVLVDEIPMPEEIKFRMKFFGDLFEPTMIWLNGKWLRTQNQALEPRLQELERRYKEVRAWPYADETPRT